MEKPIVNFTDLKVWQEGHKLVVMIFKATKDFPPAQQYGLTSQMQRSAASITANLAEGYGRSGSKEKFQFYMISRGSITELADQLLIAKDVELLTASQFLELEKQRTLTHKLLHGLIRSHKLRNS